MPRITAARSKEQRDRILDATLTCFARDGFHGATIQDIVKESDLSPGAIYGYFKSKTERDGNRDRVGATRHGA